MYICAKDNYVAVVLATRFEKALITNESEEAIQHMVEKIINTLVHIGEEEWYAQMQYGANADDPIIVQAVHAPEIYADGIMDDNISMILQTYHMWLNISAWELPFF